MMQNWDFVDPKLARKLKQLHEQLQQLKNKRKEILQNTRINSATKNKLLAFNEQCMKDLLEIYGKNKEYFVDYFDMQTVVLSNQVKSVVGNQYGKNSNIYLNCVKNCERSRSRGNKNIGNNQSFNGNNESTNVQKQQHSNQNVNQRYLQDINKKQQSQNTTKLTFDEYDKDKSINSVDLNLNLNLMKTRSRAKNYVNLNSSEMTDVEINKSAIDNGFNTTGRLTRKNYPNRVKQAKSFELNTTTNRNESYGSLGQNQYDKYDSLTNTNTYTRIQKKGSKKKTSILRIRSQQFKRKLAKKQFQLQLSKLFHQDTNFVLSKLRKQSEYDKQIINLLYRKIEILQQNKYSRQQHQNQIKEIREGYQKQARQLQQKYFELQKIQRQNKQLEFRRKQLISLHKNNP